MKKSYSRAFERYTWSLLGCMTVKDVANHLKMSWHTVKEINKTYLERHYGKPKLKDVEYLAIDEIAYKKSHKYKTIVIDLVAGRAIFVGEGRTSETLDRFWKRLKCSGAKIKTVATDMWPANWGSVGANLPGVPIIFDLYHIVKHHNKCLDDLRIKLNREKTDLNKWQLIKSSKWLLLTNEENLGTKRNKKTKLTPAEQLAEALKINQALSIDYYSKDELKEIWKQKTEALGEQKFSEWIDNAKSSGIQPLKKFCNLLKGHRLGILNWHKHPISKGPLEGLNNKLRS